MGGFGGITRFIVTWLPVTVPLIVPLKSHVCKAWVMPNSTRGPLNEALFCFKNRSIDREFCAEAEFSIPVQFPLRSVTAFTGAEWFDPHPTRTAQKKKTETLTATLLGSIAVRAAIECF
jgi:hypothetical protein